MKKYFLMLLIVIFPQFCCAALPEISLENVSINIDDKQSLERGAKFFAKTCMACHTLIYLRYDKFAQQAGVLYEKMPINVKWPAAATPPDLSLEADARGKDWIYTYLHSFYSDPKRPTGVNNLLVPNTMMPGIIMAFQGQQKLIANPKLTELLPTSWEWYDLLELQSKGSMDAGQFDATIADVVNFLSYAAEPYHQQQHRLGWKVLLFLVIFFVFAYLLKHEYWKDIKKSQPIHKNK